MDRKWTPDLTYSGSGPRSDLRQNGFSLAFARGRLRNSSLWCHNNIDCSYQDGYQSLCSVAVKAFKRRILGRVETHRSIQLKSSWEQ